MSVSSEIHYITNEELIENIKAFCSAYTKDSVKSQIDAMQKSISGTILLASANEASTFDDIGTMLYNGITEMINSLPQELKELIENNFKFNIFIDETRSDRNKIVSRKHELEVINGKELKEPNMTLCQLRIDNAISDIKERRASKEDVISTRSSEKAQDYLNNIEELEISKVTAAFKKAFVENYDMFLANLNQKNAAFEELSILKAEEEKNSVLELMMTNFKNIIAQMINKIKLEVSKYPLVKTVLEGTVKLSSTNEVISNPINGNTNLSAIIEILRNNFHKRTIVNFTVNLIEAVSYTLTEEETKNNPRKIVQDVEKINSRWETRNLWEHMTIDQFFTALIIKGLHPKDTLRRDVIHEVTKWAEEHKDSNMPSSDMGLFRHTSKFIHSEQDNRELTTYQTGGNRFSKFPKGKASNAYNLTPTEDAAAAVDNGKRFSGEVSKAKNIKTLNARKTKVPYIAMKSVAQICGNCFPDPADSSKVACQPRCFGKQCSKCRYYGHTSSQCMQSHTVDGVSVD